MGASILPSPNSSTFLTRTKTPSIHIHQPFLFPATSRRPQIPARNATTGPTDTDTDTNNDNNEARADTKTKQPVNTLNIRYTSRSRKRAIEQQQQQQQQQQQKKNVKEKPAPKEWESMTLAEKAVELYVGEKGLLFWLNKFAYASIFIIIGGWILFRFVGPSLGLYQLDAPPLAPTSILKGSSP